MTRYSRTSIISPSLTDKNSLKKCCANAESADR